MKLLSVVGARPQFVKLAPLVRAVEREKAQRGSLIHEVIHTGQHYDAGMSDVFFDELRLPPPDYNLEVGSGPHGKQTGIMLDRIEQVLTAHRPDVVIVIGDTNSTVAGALAAAKLHIPVAHLEAGLRSFNRRMPEEINRIATDHLSDLLLAPTPTAIQNLRTEGLEAKTVFSGDIMRDAVSENSVYARESVRFPKDWDILPGQYGVVTLHRADNTDNPAVLRNLLAALSDIAADGLALMFPVHPRTAKQIRETCPDWKPSKNLRLIDPLGYLEMLHLLDNACLALTDSGGLQKEAFFLGVPCITLRDETEWVETVEAGGNIIAGSDREEIVKGVAQFREQYPVKPDFSREIETFFGAGNIADRSLQAIIDLDLRLKG